jgi:hypothetical protein
MFEYVIYHNTVLWRCQEKLLFFSAHLNRLIFQGKKDILNAIPDYLIIFIRIQAAVKDSVLNNSLYGK